MTQSNIGNHIDILSRNKLKCDVSVSNFQTKANNNLKFKSY